MRSWYSLSLLLLLPTPVEAALVCLKSGTGQVLEVQSNGMAGTCQQNWVTANPQYGYTAGEIEERQVSAGEAQQLLAAWEQDAANPAVQARQQQQQAHQAVVAKVRAKLGLTPQEFQELQDALRTP